MNIVIYDKIFIDFNDLYIYSPYKKMGQTKAAKTAPTKGPTIYIQICSIGLLLPLPITWTSAGPKDLAGFKEHPEIGPPAVLIAIITDAKAKPNIEPK